MEDDGGGGGGGGGNGIGIHWWWASASTAQLSWAIYSVRKGVTGDSHFMPLKAFAVASLFVGAGASAAISVLFANGIHKRPVLMPWWNKCKSAFLVLAVCFFGAPFMFLVVFL